MPKTWTRDSAPRREGGQDEVRRGPAGQGRPFSGGRGMGGRANTGHYLPQYSSANGSGCRHEFGSNLETPAADLAVHNLAPRLEFAMHHTTTAQDLVDPAARRQIRADAAAAAKAAAAEAAAATATATLVTKTSSTASAAITSPAAAGMVSSISSSMALLVLEKGVSTLGALPPTISCISNDDLVKFLVSAGREIGKLMPSVLKAASIEFRVQSKLVLGARVPVPVVPAKKPAPGPTYVFGVSTANSPFSAQGPTLAGSLPTFTLYHAPINPFGDNSKPSPPVGSVFKGAPLTVDAFNTVGATARPAAAGTAGKWGSALTPAPVSSFGKLPGTVAIPSPLPQEKHQLQPPRQPPVQQANSNAPLALDIMACCRFMIEEPLIAAKLKENMPETAGIVLQGYEKLATAPASLSANEVYLVLKAARRMLRGILYSMDCSHLLKGGSAAFCAMVEALKPRLENAVLEVEKIIRTYKEERALAANPA